jgi:hypothetical protein
VAEGVRVTLPSKFFVAAIVVFAVGIATVAHEHGQIVGAVGWALLATGKQIAARRDRDTTEAFWAGSWAMLALYLALEVIGNVARSP